MADTRQLVFDMFRGLGVSPQAALGAMWSLGGESGAGFNPKAYNPNDPGGSLGIGQWNQTRKAALVALAGRMGLKPEDPVAQVAFLKQELTGPYSGVLGQLQGTNDSNAAAHIWTKWYEAPKVDNTEQRIAGGHRVGSLDAQGNFVLGSPGGQVNTSAPDSPAPAPASTAQLLSDAISPTALASAAPAAPAPRVASAGLSSQGLEANSAQQQQANAGTLAALSQIRSATPTMQTAQAPAPLLAAPAGGGSLPDLFKLADIGQAQQLRRPGIAGIQSPVSPRLLG